MKATFTLADQPDGSLKILVDFDSPTNLTSPKTPAERAAVDIINLIDQKARSKGMVVRAEGTAEGQE